MSPVNNVVVEVFSGFDIPSHLDRSVLISSASAYNDTALSVIPRYFNRVSNFVENKEGFIFIKDRLPRKVELIKSAFIGGIIPLVLVNATPSDIAKIKLTL